MNKQQKKILGLFARYFSIILLGIGNIYILYKLLTPLTINVLNWALSVFTETTLSGNLIHLPTITIEIIPACVAGAAFYLLLILILSTPDIKPSTRTKAIITAFAMLFALNITRILILIPMATASYFETVHWIFWHLVSTVFVVAVWLSVIKIFKIKSIPIYSDFKYIKSLMKKKSSRKSGAALKSTAQRSTGKAVLPSTAQRSKARSK